MGRWGQKQGAGYYDYDADRNATPSPVVAQLVERFATKRGTSPASISTEQIVERLLYPVVNEGAKVLAEGVAIRSSDIDVALMLGYGWPAFTGGPMFWADTIGLPRIVATLDALTSRDGASVAPSALLPRGAGDSRISSRARSVELQCSHADGLRRRFRCHGFVDVRQDDVGPCRSEQPHVLAPHALRGTRDDSGLPVELRHECSPSGDGDGLVMQVGVDSGTAALLAEA
jgi:3-hydroxyacyl-CoA dehydrogenase